MSAAIIRASFSDFRLVKGRKVAQLILEVPIEQAQAALETLGGVPMPHADRWCAVALLKEGAMAPELGPVATGRRWDEMKPSQQAGIRCHDPEFQAWVGAADESDAAAVVRRRCGVSSRSDLDRNEDASTEWWRINRDFTQRHNVASLERSLMEGRR